MSEPAPVHPAGARLRMARATLPAPVSLPDYLPARMLNEFVYCPRLFFYEWVEGLFAHSADTLDGAHRHTRHDRKEDELPPPEDAERIHARSVTLSSDALGLIAKLDLIEAYVEPVVSLDLDVAIAAEDLERILPSLEAEFEVERFPHSLNLSAQGSDLRVQFQLDPRYAAFVPGAGRRMVLGVELPVAQLEDVLQGKVWAASDARRRPRAPEGPGGHRAAARELPGAAGGRAGRDPAAAGVRRPPRSAAARGGARAPGWRSNPGRRSPAGSASRAGTCEGGGGRAACAERSLAVALANVDAGL